MNELNARIKETFQLRSESPEGLRTWKQACDIFLREYGTLAFPGGFSVGLEKIKAGDLPTIDVALVYLEHTPYCFRSQYVATTLSRALNKVALPQDLASRLTQWKKAKKERRTKSLQTTSGLLSSMSDCRRSAKVMIREYEETDWTEVCRVFDLSKPHELASGGIEASFVPLAKDEARMAQFSKSTVFVWEENQALRGFAGFDRAYIGWLFVEPSAFRKGIGRDLLQYLIAQIEGDPWLWALKTNHAAIGLYESEGFEIVDERPSQNGGMPCFAVKLTRRRQPKQPPQHNAGSRPSSNNSYASETPSSFGPRG